MRQANRQSAKPVSPGSNHSCNRARAKTYANSDSYEETYCRSDDFNAEGSLSTLDADNGRKRIHYESLPRRAGASLRRQRETYAGLVRRRIDLAEE